MLREAFILKRMSFQPIKVAGSAVGENKSLLSDTKNDVAARYSLQIIRLVFLKRHMLIDTFCAKEVRY